MHTKDDFARRILEPAADDYCASKILRKGHGELTIGLGTC
jgi:hypothetical protein